MGTHWSVLSILYLSPVCHVYSLECLVNPLFVSSMSWVLIRVSCQSSICLQYVMGTHWECPDNRQFVSSMPWVLIGVSCQSSICLHCVMGTHWSVLTILYLSPLCHGYSLECLVNPLFVSIVSWVLIGVSCQSSICLQYVMGTHWECPDNRQFVSIMSWVLIGSVLTIVNLFPVCHGYSLGVS